MVRTDGQSLGTGGSSSTAWGSRTRLRSRAGEKRKGEEETDARVPSVSEGERGERGCAVVLTRVPAGRGKCRNGKGKKREAS